MTGDLTEAIDTALRSAQEEFVADVIDTAEHTVAYDTLTIDTLRDALKSLADDGYPIEPNTEGGPLGFVGKEADTAMFDIAQNYHRSSEDRQPTDAPESIAVDSVTFHVDATLPDETVLILHPDAIAPTVPRESAQPLARVGPTDSFRVRPWVVRDPRGVVVIEPGGSADE
jgi:hypothetical protein